MIGRAAIPAMLAVVAAAIALFLAWRRRAGAASADGMAAAPRIVRPVGQPYCRAGAAPFRGRRVRSRSFLSISGSSIRFRVLSEACWSVSDLKSVDVRRTTAGASVVFLRNGRRDVLAAEVTDMAAARRVLAALPPGVPLARNASNLMRGIAGDADLRRTRLHGPIA